MCGNFWGTGIGSVVASGVGFAIGGPVGAAAGGALAGATKGEGLMPIISGGLSGYGLGSGLNSASSFLGGGEWGGLFSGDLTGAAASGLGRLTSDESGGDFNWFGSGTGGGPSRDMGGFGWDGMKTPTSNSSFGGDWTQMLKKQMSNPATMMNMLSGAYGLYNAEQMKQIAGKANPNAPYAPGYAAQLNQLISDPSSVKNTPGYQFRFDEGANAMRASGAAQGYLGSGNMGAALTRYGQDYATGSFGQQAQMLSGLTSGNQNNSAIQAQALAAQMGSGAFSNFNYPFGVANANRMMQPGAAR